MNSTFTSDIPSVAKDSIIIPRIFQRFAAKQMRAINSSRCAPEAKASETQETSN